MAYRRRRRRRRKFNIDKLKIIIVLILFAICYYNKYGLSLSAAFSEEESTVVPVSTSGNLEVEFLDVGQADSILIRDNGKNMIIDAGNNEDGKKLVEYFKSLGITRFEYVIGSHAHEDHIGGMDDIIKNFEVGHFYMPDAYTTTITFEEVLDALDAKQLKFEIPKIGETFTLNDAVIDVLYTEDNSANLNDSSIVLKLTYGNVKFLFMGDAESKTEKSILEQDIKADVLKLGHHGSSYATTLGFLNKVDPKYAVIEVGKNNSYHHPHPSTLNKLKNKNITIYRTDENGTIICQTDGVNINFNTINTDTNGGS